MRIRLHEVERDEMDEILKFVAEVAAFVAALVGALRG
jgi:hypothetical protein